MKHFLSTTLIVSLLGFSQSISAREHLVFGGLSYLQTETSKQETREQPSNDDPSVLEEEEISTLTSGSRPGVRVFYRTFEVDGIYLGAGYERAEGDYDKCIGEDCIDIAQTVDELNLELGWTTRNNWTPFVEFVRFQTESDAPSVSDDEAEIDFGVGMYYESDENIKVKLYVNGLHDSDRLAFGAGFQRRLDNDILMDGSFSFPVAEDVTGYGFKFSLGRTL